MKIFMTFSILLLVLISKAQILDTLYFDKENKIVSKQEFYYYRVADHNTNNMELSIYDKYINGNMKMIAKYNTLTKKSKKIDILYPDKCDQLRIKSKIDWYENGKLKSNEKYYWKTSTQDFGGFEMEMEKAFFEKGVYYEENGDSIILNPQKNPCYIGGAEGLKKDLDRLLYENPQVKGINTGIAIIKVVIDESGSLIKSETKDLLNPWIEIQLEKILLTNITQNWEPGEEKNIKVKSYFIYQYMYVIMK